MITTTRKIWTKKISESPYRELGGFPYKLVDGNKYEDTGEMAQVFDFSSIPTISAWGRNDIGNMVVLASYPNKDATSTITASTNTIVWKSQILPNYLKAVLEPGDEILISGTKFNDGKYTISTISYSVPNTNTIVVTEDIVADETCGIVEDGYTTVTTATYYNVNDTSSITASTNTIVWKGQDLTATLEAGDVFWLDNTASNDGTYTVDTIVFSTDTTIVVLEDTLVNETLDNADEAITFTTEVVYTNSDATSSITATTGVITLVAQDWTDYLVSGDVITIANCTESGNNAAFTIDTIDYDDTTALATVITVVDPTGMVDETLNGQDETITINGEEITYTNFDATSSATAATKTFVIKGQDLTDHILADDEFTIAGSQSNDGTYTVASIAFSTDTTIVVDETVVDEVFSRNPELIRHDTL